jgi:hypothetical protein
LAASFLLSRPLLPALSPPPFALVLELALEVALTLVVPVQVPVLALVSVQLALVALVVVMVLALTPLASFQMFRPRITAQS